MSFDAPKIRTEQDKGGFLSQIWLIKMHPSKLWAMEVNFEIQVAAKTYIRSYKKDSCNVQPSTELVLSRVWLQNIQVVEVKLRWDVGGEFK